MASECHRNYILTVNLLAFDSMTVKAARRYTINLIAYQLQPRSFKVMTW